MHRRTFLASSALLPLAMHRVPFATPLSPLFTALGSDPSDRVLVLINLIGGNDGLASLVPLDQYDQLAQVRANILLPQNTLHTLDSTRGLHASLTGFKSVWDTGRMGIVQDVGYPDQNRSHFRSSDIWNTGSPSNEEWTTGWLGRHFETVHPTFPTDYPNQQHPDPVAISLGYAVSETCQGIAGNFALTVNNPQYAGGILDNSGGSTPPGIYGDELSFIRTSIAQANAYGDVVRDAADRGMNVGSYPSNNQLASRLADVARLISGGLQTKVYIVSLGGFDTHADQVVEGDVTTGEHAALLQQLGDAVAAFQADINALGLGERVIGMTFSEFGRRIRSNAAVGTDHGTAAPAFLFGDCINPGVIGNNPTIDIAVDELEGVPMQYDFRDLYGSVLEDWFGLSASTVRTLLHNGYTNIPVVRNCSDISSVDTGINDTSTRLLAAPSPFTTFVKLQFATHATAKVSMSAYDVKGGLVETLFERKLPAGEQTVTVDTSTYPSGVIVFRLQEGSRVRVVRTIKL